MGLALSLVVGGAVGNLIDRARFGAVVDFIDFSGPWFGMVIGISVKGMTCRRPRSKRWSLWKIMLPKFLLVMSQN